MELDLVDAPFAQGIREIDKDGARIARVFQFGRIQQNAVHLQRIVKIQLNARVVLQHPETDGVLSTQELLLRIHAHIEVVREQIVVSAIPAVLATQDVGVRRRLRGGAPCQHGG